MEIIATIHDGLHSKRSLRFRALRIETDDCGGRVYVVSREIGDQLNKVVSGIYDCVLGEYMGSPVVTISGETATIRNNHAQRKGGLSDEI